MKKNYLFTFLLIAAFISISPRNTFAWGSDILIHSGNTIATHSIEAKTNGTLYTCLPVDAGLGNYNLLVYKSIDKGLTWTNTSFITATSPAPILKTKMVHSGSDSVYCLYLTGLSVKILNVESGVLGTFNQNPIVDFDAAASPNGNAIYLFTSELGNFNLRRFGTIDGGLTWTGNTALVASNGFGPRVCMSGTRLILNYYGPLQTDTTSAVIRSAFYNESTPGTLAAGTFQNLATNTAVNKKQFLSVKNGNTVWFFFTEGSSQQVIKCMVSSDNGVSYSPEQIIAGNAGSSALKMDAKIYSDANGGGCYLAYYAISQTSIADQVMVSQSAVTSPTLFEPAIAINDHLVSETPIYQLPALVTFLDNGSPNATVVWVENAGTQEMVYCDNSPIITANQELELSTKFTMNLMPNPTDENLTIQLEKNLVNCLLVIFDITGQEVSRCLFNGKSQTMQLAKLVPGKYFIQLQTGKETLHSSFIKK